MTTEPEEISTKPTCPSCGGENISVDAAARWNHETKDWEISAIYDGGFCDDCEDTTKFFDWVPIT